MGSHNLIEERFTLHQMSGSLRIRSLKSLCHMGNCNLIVAILLPGTAEKHIGKKIFLFHWLCFFGEPSQFYDTRLYQQYPQRFYFYIFRTLLWPIPNISGLVYLGSMWSEDGICQTQDNDTKRRQGSTLPVHAICFRDTHHVIVEIHERRKTNISINNSNIVLTCST